MNILIGFEESGVIREAYRNKGHNAWSCDLEPARDNSKYHLQCDFIKAVFSRKWDLIIMHPPCTALTVAGNHVYAKGKPKYQERLVAIAVIEKYWISATGVCDRVCLENPQGVIHTNLPELPKPQYIQPHQFGEDASKKTGLTLHGLPPLKPTKRIKGRIVDGVERWSNQTDSGQNKLGPSPTRSRDRSKTYQGIADAMVNQWGDL